MGGYRAAVVLTQDRVSQWFTDGIFVTSLPQAIQDAITVTHKLDVSFLWIDALCIIQDSKLDMTQELCKMDSIYENALVTLVDADQDSSAGFLNPDIERDAHFLASGPLHRAHCLPRRE